MRASKTGKQVSDFLNELRANLSIDLFICHQFHEEPQLLNAIRDFMDHNGINTKKLQLIQEIGLITDNFFSILYPDSFRDVFRRFYLTKSPKTTPPVQQLDILRPQEQKRPIKPQKSLEGDGFHMETWRKITMATLHFQMREIENAFAQLNNNTKTQIGIPTLQSIESV